MAGAGIAAALPCVDVPLRVDDGDYLMAFGDFGP
jgi:hypothetical protein